MILQPYDMEVGAGTFHPATTLRALGPKPWNAAYVQPSRRPKDGRYGENPNRLQHYYQFQVILKPSPPDLQDLYLNSLEAIGIDPPSTTSASSRTTGKARRSAPGGSAGNAGATAWRCRSSPISSRSPASNARRSSGELTYGLERLAMLCAGRRQHHATSISTAAKTTSKVTYGDVFLQAEQEYSRHNFEFADTDMLFEQFRMAEAACRKYLDAGWANGRTRRGT